MNGINEHSIEANITCKDKTLAILLRTQEFNLIKRINRILVKFFIGLPVLLILAFIPIVHFIVLPIGLVAFFYLLYSSFSIKKMIISCAGKCPACDADFEIYPTKYSHEIRDVCSSCKRECIISVK